MLLCCAMSSTCRGWRWGWWAPVALSFCALVQSWDAPGLDFGAVAPALSQPEPPVAAAWGSSAQIKTKLSFQRIQETVFQNKAVLNKERAAGGRVLQHSPTALLYSAAVSQGCRCCPRLELLLTAGFVPPRALISGHGEGRSRGREGGRSRAPKQMDVMAAGGSPLHPWGATL